jgi:hypothetical protein
MQQDRPTAAKKTMLAPKVSPEAYLRALHPPSGRGKPVVLMIDGPDKIRSAATPSELLPTIASAWAEGTSYISLNRFHGVRRVSRLAALNALYVDLDTYNCPSLSQLMDEALDRVILDHVSLIGLPPPSFLLDTGRGRAAVWLIRELPAAAHPRWRACQRALVAACKLLEADPACTDAARVFRLPGSTNGKSGREVTVRGGTGRRHAFDELADGFYRATGRPTREQLEKQKAARESFTSGNTYRQTDPGRSAPAPPL